MTDNIKNYLILILALLVAGILIFGYNQNSDFRKKKKELDEKISSLEKLDKELLDAQKIKEGQLVILEDKYKLDSLKLDSLKDKYADAKETAVESENKANLYKGRYTEAKNKIIYLESHTINIKGDSLLISLSKKIN